MERSISSAVRFKVNPAFWAGSTMAIRMLLSTE
jgi:hypothetical protein